MLIPLNALKGKLIAGPANVVEAFSVFLYFFIYYSIFPPLLSAER
jgi:hypothetical protein